MSLISEPLFFTLALLDTGIILFVLVYFVIILSDLECDYLNARQCCSRLNKWVIPKTVAHSVLNLCLLLYGHWILFLMNLPLTIWLWYEYLTVPKGNTGVFDPTEIHNCRLLRRHTRDTMIYLGYYLVFFFIYLYCMIISLLKGDPIDRSDDDNVEF
ncbi:hypothetical protein HCN44_000202 [Aphidius gifuensis]|uniref:Protein cornichon homolog 4 n=1 Tax=Aphidius gifuensis TaxID=684658 RepID=A0A834XRK9_APHGI|nr:protein cornichon homolog 4 [Aphidius gifuensis]KAF7990397.1 hypothetical protein HCN44_000202 [Aphidius gifuensis]